MTQPGQNSEFAPLILASYRQGVTALQQGLDGINREWGALIDRINRLLERVEHELNNDSIWATISEWWTEAIANAIKKVHTVVQDVGNKIKQILDALEKAVHGSMPIGSLFEVGLDWATRVDVPLSDLGPDLTGSGKVDHWRGPTKQTYEKRVTYQADAVDSSVEKVKATSIWLADVAAANTTYMVQLGERAAEIVRAIVTVAVDATETASGAVTQLVVALQHSSEFIGTAVHEALGYVLHLAERLSDVLKQITGLAVEYGDHKGLPQGKWPSPINV